VADIEWKLSDAQAEVIHDRSRYLIVEGAAGSSARQYLQHIKQ